MGVTDWNEISKPGIYSGNCSTAKNSPEGLRTWMNAIAIATNGGEQYLQVIAFGINGDAFIRYMAIGKWNSWVKMR